jgi:hypothetical protein
MRNIERSYTIQEKTYTETAQFASIYYNPDYGSLYGQKLSEMKYAYQKLSSINSYYEINSQFLYVPNFQFGEKFLYGYEEGVSNDSIYMLEKEQEIIPLHAIKTFQLSANCMNQFQLKKQQGRLLEAADWDITNSNTLPVLVGNEYAEYLNIGDQFIGSYILKNITFEVVGILKANSNISLNGVAVYLDRYIIMPSFNCIDPTDTDDDIFQVRHYSNKLQGKFPIDALPEIQSCLASINSLEIGRFSVLGEDPLQGMYTGIIASVGISTQTLLITLIVAVMILCPALLFVFFKDNIDIYSVMFMSGYSIRQLRISFFICFTILISIELMLILGYTYLFGLHFDLLNVVVAFCIITIAIVQIRLLISSKSMLLWMEAGKNVGLNSHK